jgi:glycosyltransferase involved in cell wall biosynthesis
MGKLCPKSISSSGAPYRLAVLASHPIQYQAPLFRALAAHPEIDLHVYFLCRRGLELYNDPGFRVSFSWDTPLMEGYRSTFLHNLSPRPAPKWFMGLANLGLVSVVRQDQFDAFWLHGWALASNWIGWAAAIASGVPIFLRGEANGLAEPKGMRKAVKRCALKAFFRPIAAFLAIGTNNANFYMSYGVSEERIFWTPYAVDNSFFMDHARRLDGQKGMLREKAGIPPDLPVILFCGKFLEQKRPFDLLRAFAYLHDHAKVSLVFVGDGPLRVDMERFIAEQQLTGVYLLGFRNQTELPACYAMADVLVLPSGSEPWGLVINEAMCFGLPIIASDQVGAAIDLIQEGVNGFTYPVGNTSALADCLQKVLAHEETCQAMGRQSHAIISRWGIGQDVEGVVQALHAVIGRRRRTARYRGI